MGRPPLAPTPNQANSARCRRFARPLRVAFASAVVLLVLLALGAAALPARAEVEIYGRPLRGLTPVPLARLVDAPAAYDGRTVRTEGTIAAVSGGTVTLEEGGKSLRVVAKDRAFALPANAVGSRAAVEGAFTAAGPRLEATGLERRRGGGR